MKIHRYMYYEQVYTHGGIKIFMDGIHSVGRFGCDGYSYSLTTAANSTVISSGFPPTYSHDSASEPSFAKGER